MKPAAETSFERLGATLLLLAVALVWPGALAGPFQFDDWNVIVEQPAAHSLAAWWASMPGIRPLLKLSYALNWSGPTSAAAFHLVNLLIHAANVWLLWQLLRFWPQLDRRAAWWVALIFALHPVQTEAVTYISGRSMSLMALFWLAAANCWFNAVATNSRTWRAAALVLFCAAIAVRETAWSLPFVLLFWQRAQGQSWRSSGRALWPLWGALAIAAVGIIAQPGYRQMLASALATRNPLANLALQVHSLAYLLVEPLLLLRNNIDPDLPSAARYDAAWCLAALVLVALLALGWRGLTRRPAIGLALLWPFLLLMPTNGLIARLDPASERHLYLALIGPAVLLVQGLCGRWPARLVGPILSVLCVGLAFATMQRNIDYRSESALWEATRLGSPGKPRVWNNLGYAHLAEGRPDLALPALQRALALDPDFMRAELNRDRAERELAGRDARPAAKKSADPAVAAALKDQ